MVVARSVAQTADFFGLIVRKQSFRSGRARADPGSFGGSDRESVIWQPMRSPLSGRSPRTASGGIAPFAAVQAASAAFDSGYPYRDLVACGARRPLVSHPSSAIIDLWKTALKSEF